MFEALKQRLDDIETAVDRAVPKAAIAIATKLRADVTRSRRAAGKRRKAARTDLRTRGFSAKEARSRVGAAPKGSGIPIVVKDDGASISVSASTEVHFIARRNSEPAEWVDIVAQAIEKAAAGKGGR